MRGMRIVRRSLQHMTVKHKRPPPWVGAVVCRGGGGGGHSSGVLVLVLVLRAGQDRVGQSYIQVVVVLDQGDVFVVEH